jgi:hypothetical protein
MQALKGRGSPLQNAECCCRPNHQKQIYRIPFVRLCTLNIRDNREIRGCGVLNLHSFIPNSTVMASISSIAEQLYSVRIYIPILFAVSYFIHSYVSYRRLSHISGPRLAGWSSLWLVGAVWRKQSHLEFYEVAKQYGKCQWNLMLSICTTVLLMTHSRITCQNRTKYPTHYRFGAIETYERREISLREIKVVSCISACSC